jgi:YD repeat-containing protein
MVERYRSRSACKTHTQYDPAGNAVAVIDARGAVTRYRYDQLNRRVEIQAPKHDAPTEADSRNKPWVYDTLRDIAGGFKQDSGGINLDIRVPSNTMRFKLSMDMPTTFHRIR